MRTRTLLPTAFVLLLPFSGCVYYNSIYNAERELSRAEALRRGGFDASAEALYEAALRKAAAGYRKDPGGEWAAEALFIGGRAALELGKAARAEAFLAASSEIAREAGHEEMALEATVYRARALARMGRSFAALEVLTPSLNRLDPSPAVATGYLTRARIRLERGMTEGADRDLTTAAAVGPEYALDAAMIRMALAIERRRSDWALDAAEDMLVVSGAHWRSEAFIALLRQGAAEDALEPALRMLVETRRSGWPPAERDRIRLAAARLLYQRGDTAVGLSVAGELAIVSDVAGEARFWIATERITQVREAGELPGLRDFLRPASDHAGAAELSEKIDGLLSLMEGAASDPVALFAAAELAREGLGADLLARTLFIAFADLDPAGPWAGKSLLAALALTPDSEAASLASRLDTMRDDPYLLAATGSPAQDELEALEAELDRRMLGLRAG